MKAVLRRCKGQDRLSVVFGSGLIGGALWSRICREGTVLPGRQLRWSDPADLRRVLDEFSTEELSDSTRDVEIFWCAGKVGPLSAKLDCDREQLLFEGFCSWLEALSVTHRVSVLYLSSAGALHEGMRRVDRSAAVVTTSPYARLKIEQENRLTGIDGIRTQVFRLSTVYGGTSGKGRRGLVSVLIENLIRRKTSLIYGSPHTCRDFVSVSDVSLYLSKFDEYECEARYLVSGRPTSITEIQKMIEKRIGTRLMVTYSNNLRNDGSTTFSSHIKDPKFRSGLLEHHLQSLYLDALAAI